MRVLLLLSLFVIWQQYSPELAGWSPLRRGGGLGIFAVGYLAAVATAAWMGRQWVRHQGGVGPVARPVAFERALMLGRYFISIWLAIGVFGLGWHAAVDRAAGTEYLTPGTLIGVAPAVAAWAGLWWAAYPVERAVREYNMVYDVNAGLPVYAFPTLTQFLGSRLRAQVLFTAVPVVAVLAARDVAAGVWRHALGHAPLSDAAEGGVSAVALVVVVFGSPVVLRHVLQTSPMAASPLRDRLSAIGEAARVRCRDILMWDTHFNTGNAAVMGLARPVRYVMLSDLLVGSMTDLQIEAVYAHELGHVRHRHLTWFIAYIIGVTAGLFAATDAVDRHLHAGGVVHAMVDVAMSIGGLAVVLVGFGFLSRWFERQADVFAARTVDPDVGRGAYVFASALSRVATINNVSPTAPNWTHGSIANRCAYVLRLAADPSEGRRFDRTGRRVLAALVAAIAGGVGVAALSALS